MVFDGSTTGKMGDYLSKSDSPPDSSHSPFYDYTKHVNTNDTKHLDPRHCAQWPASGRNGRSAASQWRHGGWGNRNGWQRPMADRQRCHERYTHCQGATTHAADNLQRILSMATAPDPHGTTDRKDGLDRARYIQGKNRRQRASMGNTPPSVHLCVALRPCASAQESRGIVTWLRQ